MNLDLIGAGGEGGKLGRGPRLTFAQSDPSCNQLAPCPHEHPFAFPPADPLRYTPWKSLSQTRTPYLKLVSARSDVLIRVL